MNNYAKMAKEMHWPSVSPKKQQEMKDIRRKLDIKNKRRTALSTNRINSTSVQRVNEEGSESNTHNAIPDIRSRNIMRKQNTNTNRKWDKSLYSEMLEQKRK